MIVCFIHSRGVHIQVQRHAPTLFALPPKPTYRKGCMNTNHRGYMVHVHDIHVNRKQHVSLL